MKYLILFFLFTQGFSYDLPEITIPGLLKQMWQAGKTIKKEGNKPPARVQAFIDQKWGTEIQESKQEWERLSDTTKVDTVSSVDSLKQQNAFDNVNIILQEEDMLIHFKGDSLQTLILWE